MTVGQPLWRQRDIRRDLNSTHTMNFLGGTVRMHARMFAAALNKVTKFTSLTDSRTVDQQAPRHPTIGSQHLQ